MCRHDHARGLQDRPGKLVPAQSAWSSGRVPMIGATPLGGLGSLEHRGHVKGNALLGCLVAPLGGEVEWV